MLQVENVSKSFGGAAVLKRVTFDLQPSTVTGLIGPSGSGKSVLLKIIAGVIKSDSGLFRLGNIHRADMSLMFQEGALFDSISVFDNVAFPLVRGNVPTSRLPRRLQCTLAEQVMEILARVGLSDAAYKMPAQLSGGMRRRVSLARALVSHQKLLLLDDPTCGLDPVASSVILNLILELQRDYGPTLVLVSHDLRRLLPNVDNILALFDGEMVFEGDLPALRGRAPLEVQHFVACRYDLNGGAAVSAGL